MAVFATVLFEQMMERQNQKTIIFVNGARAPLRVGFVNCMILNHRFQLFVIGSIALFAAIRPYHQSVSLERWQAITIVALMGILVFAIYILSFYLLAVISKWLKINNIFSFWLLLGGALLASYLGQQSLKLFEVTPSSFLVTAMICVFHLIMFIALETIFAIAVLPQILVKLSPFEQSEPLQSHHEAVQSPQEEISPVDFLPAVVISDRRFLAQDIKRVSAQEHYISVITFEDQNYFVRGRMRDFLMQIPEDLGYCIHRSHWVAWTGIRRVDVGKDNMVVELDDNIALPVARGRRSDFIARWKRKSNGWLA